jgi:putative salt-induced outer membrane protein YdiY
MRKPFPVPSLKSAPPAMIALGILIASLTQLEAQTPTTNASPWASSAAAGLTLTRGNSRTTLVTANIETKRKTPLDEIILEGDATYGESDGTENAELLHGSAQYNRKITGDLYWGLLGDALHDGIADVRYRLTLAPLLGYYIINHTNTTLAVEAGPGFVYQDQGSGTNENKDGFVTLRFAERFEHKFNATARVWQSIEILPRIDDFNDYYLSGEIGVEATMTKHVKLRTYLDDTYYNVPAAGRLKNDVKLVGAVAYTF